MPKLLWDSVSMGVAAVSCWLVVTHLPWTTPTKIAIGSTTFSVTRDLATGFANTIVAAWLTTRRLRRDLRDDLTRLDAASTDRTRWSLLLKQLRMLKELSRIIDNRAIDACIVELEQCEKYDSYDVVPQNLRGLASTRSFVRR